MKRNPHAAEAVGRGRNGDEIRDLSKKA